MSGRPSLSLGYPLWSVRTLLTHPAYFWVVAVLVWLGDAALTQLIIRFVAYTEIDFSTYMEQTAIYDKGERDYVLISGSTGPVVYPAGHLYLHSFLSEISDAGKNQVILQQLYGALYLACLALTIAVYRRAGNFPPGALVLLVLSKRLHSIFVLRLFNDCWNVTIMMGSVLAYSYKRWSLGSALFSIALLIKMNALLYLPAILLILFQSIGLVATLQHVFLLILPIQVLAGLPFLLHNPQSYLKSAFDLGRVFLYKWTVNWRFVPEEIFLSQKFASGLLAGHLIELVMLLVFVWSKRDGGIYALVERGLRRPTLPASLVPPSPDYIVTVMFTTNLVGIMFARSLHYQFYSWYAFQIPFLLWRSPYPLPMKLLLWAAIEYAWNVFPSTNVSSMVLLLGNAALLGGAAAGPVDADSAVKGQKGKE